MTVKVIKPMWIKINLTTIQTRKVSEISKDKLVLSNSWMKKKLEKITTIDKTSRW